MPYYKGVMGDIVVEEDNHEEAVKAMYRRFVAGEVPLLTVEEVSMTLDEAAEYETLEDPKGPWVAVGVLGLLVDEVQIFWTEKEAKDWFKEYTNYDYDEWIQSNEPLDLEYDQCKIFVLGEREKQ